MNRPHQLRYEGPRAAPRRKWMHAAGLAISILSACGVVFTLPILYLAYEAVWEGDNHADRGVRAAYSVLATFCITLLFGIILSLKAPP